MMILKGKDLNLKRNYIVEQDELVPEDRLETEESEIVEDQHVNTLES